MRAGQFGQGVFGELAAAEQMCAHPGRYFGQGGLAAELRPGREAGGLDRLGARKELANPLTIAGERVGCEDRREERQVLRQEEPRIEQDKGRFRASHALGKAEPARRVEQTLKAEFGRGQDRTFAAGWVLEQQLLRGLRVAARRFKRCLELG